MYISGFDNWRMSRMWAHLLLLACTLIFSYDYLKFSKTICYKILKKPYLRTIIGSSERYCILIILFQLYYSKAGHFEHNLFWVGQYDHSIIICEEHLNQYWYKLNNLIQWLRNLPKIIPIQKTPDIILID